MCEHVSGYQGAKRAHLGAQLRHFNFKCALEVEVRAVPGVMKACMKNECTQTAEPSAHTCFSHKATTHFWNAALRSSGSCCTQASCTKAEFAQTHVRLTRFEVNREMLQKGQSKPWFGPYFVQEKRTINLVETTAVLPWERGLVRKLETTGPRR